MAGLFGSPVRSKKTGARPPSRPRPYKPRGFSCGLNVPRREAICQRGAAGNRRTTQTSCQGGSGPCERSHPGTICLQSAAPGADRCRMGTAGIQSLQTDGAWARFCSNQTPLGYGLRRWTSRKRRYAARRYSGALDQSCPCGGCLRQVAAHRTQAATVCTGAGAKGAATSPRRRQMAPGYDSVQPLSDLGLMCTKILGHPSIGGAPTSHFTEPVPGGRTRAAPVCSGITHIRHMFAQVRPRSHPRGICLR